MRLGLSMRQPNGRTIIQRAIASLRARGSDAHLWLPGVGTVNGLTTGNYLESTGNTLATVDNPTGLVLDALGTVGGELVTNGGFDSDTGWTKEANWAIGSGVASKTAGVAGSIYQGAPTGLAQNTYCRVTFTATRTAGTCYLFLRNTDSTLAVNASGTYSVMVKAGANSAYGINIYAAADFAGSIDNISVREVTGIHLTQGTTANKPVLRRGLTNLLTYSNYLSDASWTKTGVTISGSAGAQTLTTTATSYSYTNKTVSGSGIGTTITAYRLVKAGTLSIATLGSNGDKDAYFNLATKATSVAGTGSTPTNVECVDVSGGYVLCVATWVKAGANQNVYFAMTNAFGSQTSGIGDTLLTNGQGASIGSYTAAQILASGGVPVTTTAAASNPNAGKYSWSFDGSNDSLALGSVPFALSDDWAVVASAKIGVPLGWSTLFGASGAGTTPRLQFYVNHSTGCVSLYLRDDAGANATFAGTTDVRNSTIVLSAVKVGSSVVIRVNGVQVAQTTSSLGVATFTGASLGMLYGGGDYFAGSIYYCNPIKGTLTDTELLQVERLAASAAGITI